MSLCTPHGHDHQLRPVPQPGIGVPLPSPLLTTIRVSPRPIHPGGMLGKQALVRGEHRTHKRQAHLSPVGVSAEHHISAPAPYSSSSPGRWDSSTFSAPSRHRTRIRSGGGLPERVPVPEDRGSNPTAPPG